jgi:hypothetical protein
MFCYIVTKMDNNLKQHYSIKFVSSLEKALSIPTKKIQAFGNGSLSRAEVFQWHKDFVHAQEMLEHEP